MNGEKGFEEGAVMLAGLDYNLIHQALNILDHQPRGSERLLNIVDDYKTTNVSSKVLRIILSYTAFVNRRVWHKK